MDKIIHELYLSERCEAYDPLSAHNYVDFLIIATSIGIIIFAYRSWETITDFRSFKNYIFIYVIINNTVNAIFRNISIECIADKFNDPVAVLAILVIAESLHNYFEFTANYWLMLLFYDIYLNLFKIDSNHIETRYLKAKLWGWGVPFLICLFADFTIPALIPAPGSFTIFVKIRFMLIPLVFNVMISIILFFSQLKTKTVSTIGEKKCRYLKTSIFLFLLCTLSSLTTVMLMSECVSKSSLQLIKFLSSLQDVTVILYFFTSKHNMSLWIEHYGKIKVKKH